jgi:hypothetical protein
VPVDGSVFDHHVARLAEIDAAAAAFEASCAQLTATS